ncbi:peptide maturation system acyl carrier-related protein [Ruminiclostridium josui]|uniref:peptide maturation system acyl carrier-related protein n=1 Tax=Ruminiclostridium josui TaxID=1499 RepID=UPI0004B275F4|nr:peptide maturation system acyl carrier-related protein [Ruminiclostridium josui]
MTEEIFMRLNDIFLKRFNIDLKSKSTMDYDKHLLGKEWGLEPRDLLILFMDIESQFGISISEKDIENGNFSSINNLVKMI